MHRLQSSIGLQNDLRSCNRFFLANPNGYGRENVTYKLHPRFTIKWNNLLPIEISGFFI